MADNDKGLGPVKRFGTRYGTTVKYKRAQVEKEQKKPQKCPYCLKLAAKRIAEGIYVCHKCNSKFTGGAYSVTPVKIQETQSTQAHPVEEAVQDEDFDETLDETAEAA